jgi:ribose transport system ATP-binding protein
MSVAAQHIGKSFVGKRVLDDVGIAVADGEIHALLGANGSGKSTLVKILTGVYQPDAGEILIGGRRLDSIASPYLANRLGIAVVHQEAPLIDTSTVAECIALFRGYPSAGGRVLWNKLHRDVADMLERFDLRIDPKQLAGTLSPAERALVALIIALDRVSSGLNLLVLDEVTASLPRDEAEPYLDRVAALARGGVSVLMVTHRLAELRGRAATMTILRDGRTVFAGQTAGIDDDTIIAQMVGEAGQRPHGRSMPKAQGQTARATGALGDVLLKIDHLKVEQLTDVSLELHRHEILGIAGLAETGISELPNVLSGALAYHGGQITVNGRVLPRDGGPRAAIRAGIAVLPADRLRSGGIPTLSVGENVSLPDVDRYFMRPAAERSMVEGVIADFDVRPPEAQALFGRLSGGNQQKALLGKWLHLKPSVLVLDDPTSGVDPGARATIFAILQEAAREGLGILFFSTEPEQLAAMCSRVLVLKDGGIGTELTGADLNHQTISQWCYA